MQQLCSPAKVEKRSTPRSCAMLVLVLAFSTFAAAQNLSDVGYHFERWTPLGTETMVLKPSGDRLSMLLSLDSAFMDGATKVMDGGKAVLRQVDGTVLERFPSEISFRFTIGSRTYLQDKDPNVLETKLSASDIQDHVQFELLVFDGLQEVSLKPKEVTMLGVPASIPYNERIYKVTFPVDHVSMQRRMKLLILDPGGNRLVKYQLAIF